jgi:hypothetical protein
MFPHVKRQKTCIQNNSTGVLVPSSTQYLLALTFFNKKFVSLLIINYFIMKKISTQVKTGLLTLLFLGISSFGFAQLAFDKAPLAMAEMALEASTLDYGTIAHNSDGTRILKFTNTGDAPLIITNVKASCGCTVPSYSKTAVLPNEKGEIMVKYNTKKMGAFNKTVTITSNAEVPQQTFKIKGIVVAEI